MLIKYFSVFAKYPGLLHSFSTRQGGLSTAPFDSLNLGLHTADNKQIVTANRSLYFNMMSVDSDRIVMPEQVHSDHVAVAEHPGSIKACDALITNQRDLFLSIQTADCFPVFIYCPQVPALGLVHSGWRGTARNIVGKTIAMMTDRFGSSPDQLRVAVGPGVLQSCYQVDDSTAGHFSSEYLIDDGPGHYRLDVQAAIIGQILQSGVKREHMEVDRTCTHCAANLYYSYRRDGHKSGRMMALMGIRS